MVAALAAGCRHVAPAGRLATDWQTLSRPAGSFTALYRLACCGHRDLLATVRCGETALALTVVAPPGATVAQCWIGEDGGWLAEDRGRCRRRLGAGSLPLGAGTVLPLDHRMAAALLSGRVPAGGRPAADPGWVEGRASGWEWQAEIVGSPPRCVRFRLSRERGGAAALEAELRAHRGSLPGELTIRAGGERVEVVLQEWRGTPGPETPPWLSAPSCGGEA